VIPTSAKGRQIWGTEQGIQVVIPTSAKRRQIWGTEALLYNLFRGENFRVAVRANSASNNELER